MPYDGVDGTKENPSIYCSDDNETWAVPAGITNPIVLYVAGAQNADTELVVENSVMYIVYMFNSGGLSYIKEVHTADMITWTSPAELFHTANDAIVSPAILWDGSQWVMYSINLVSEPNTMERRTAASMLGSWSSASTCTVYLPTSYLWHLAVRYYSGVYYALLNLGQVSLWLATSSDGFTWSVPSPALLADSALDIWDKHLYRASFTKEGSTIRIWYTGYNGTAWRIGYTEAT